MARGRHHLERSAARGTAASLSHERPTQPPSAARSHCIVVCSMPNHRAHPGGFGDDRVVVVRLLSDEVRGERRLRRAHCPDVQIVNGGHAGQALEVGVDSLRVNRFGHRMQDQVDRFSSRPQCWPG